MLIQTNTRIRTFNSRPLKEVDHAPRQSPFSIELFQFTTSQGGRLLVIGFQRLIVIFQFTTSQGGRLRLTC